MGDHAMDTSDRRFKKIRRTANLFIYASVLLGILLLIQLYFLSVPLFLPYSILIGWVLYAIVAVAASREMGIAYPGAALLAIITLVVSLPQQEHYSFANTSQSLALVTFLAGSVLQIGVIIMTGYTIILERRETSLRSGSSPSTP